MTANDKRTISAAFFSILILFLILSVFAGCRGGQRQVAVQPSPPLSLAQCATSKLVDDFQLKADTPTFARAFAAAPDGTLYVSGYALDSSNLTHALLRRSDDGGATWQTVSDQPGLTVTALATGPKGEIYVAASGGVVISTDKGGTWKLAGGPDPRLHISSITGIAIDGSGIPYYAAAVAVRGAPRDWFVLKGTDFSVLDHFNKDVDNGVVAAAPAAITLDGSGALFVVGSADDTSGVSHWVVRESSDGGKTWTSVDNFQDGNDSAMAASVATDKAGGVYVAGRDVDYAGNRWLLRKSGDGGATWVTADDFRSADHKDASARFVFDSGGLPVVVGSATAADGSGSHWTSRSAGSDGKIWKIIDNFQYGANDEALAFGGGVAPDGAVYVVGEANDDGAHSHWIVRRLTTCR